jgi:hypothetical protein
VQFSAQNIIFPTIDKGSYYSTSRYMYIVLQNVPEYRYPLYLLHNYSCSPWLASRNNKHHQLHA